MNTLNIPTIANIENPELRAKLQHLLDSKTKPIGALGKLETLAIKIGLIQSTTSPKIENPQIVVFAADHGLAQHGVSAYPSEVTAQMVINFLNGGAAINVLARQHQMQLKIVDAGVAANFSVLLANNIDSYPQLLTDYKVRFGSRDSLYEPAMTSEECLQALQAGIDIAKQLQGDLFIAGEMGIGNTSAASLLLSRLEDMAIDECVGRGTGLDDSGVAHKLDILRQVLNRHAHATTPLLALAALGGLEIAMMVGAFMQAAHDRRVILIDGFIASSALLVAERLAPGVAQFAIFAHHSLEPGHAQLLSILDIEPLLNFEMRLGEGSGAALAYPLLQSACAIINEMASFADAGVSEKHR